MNSVSDLSPSSALTSTNSWASISYCHIKSFGKDILKKADVFGRFFYLVPRKGGDGPSGDAFQSPVLPSELCDLIMDFLFDDRGALCSCSLVCSAWLPTTRLHLFNTIKISQFKPRNRLPDALRTIIARRKKNHMDVRLGKLLRSPKCTFTKLLLVLLVNLFAEDTHLSL